MSVSSAQHIGTDFWNCLSLCMFEAMQVLKGGYKGGILTANLKGLALAKELNCPVEELLCEVMTGCWLHNVLVIMHR